MISAHVAALLAWAAVGSALHARQWQRIDNCRWIPNRWNDGDSFHVLTGDAQREIVVRLYFIDAPEAETAYRDRLDEQAAYFGITREQAIQVAHEAAAFTRERLAHPFTIWSRWRSARGRSVLGRVYCRIVDSDGRDLAEELIENGLARIYGTRTPLPDGRDSRTYLRHLHELEAEAKTAKRGGWGFAMTKCSTPVQTVGTKWPNVIPFPPNVFVAAGCPR